MMFEDLCICKENWNVYFEVALKLKEKKETSFYQLEIELIGLHICFQLCV